MFQFKFPFKWPGAKAPLKSDIPEDPPAEENEGSPEHTPDPEETPSAPTLTPEERKARRAVLLHRIAMILTWVGLGLLAVAALVLMHLSGRARETVETAPLPSPTAAPAPISFSAAVDPEMLRFEGEVAYIGNELLAVSASGQSYTEMERFFGERGIRIIGFVELTDTYQLRLPEEQSLAGLNRAAAELAQTDEVDLAAVNAVWQPQCQSVPDDPWDGRTDWEEPAPGTDNWGLMAIRAPESWDLVQTEEVPLGIIDLGFDPRHEDLNYDLLRGNESFDRLSDPERPALRGHGTHMASVAGAVHDNGLGLSGSAKNARVSGCAVGTWCGSIQLLDAAACLSDRDVRVAVIGLGYSEQLQRLAMEGERSVLRYYYEEPAQILNLGLSRMLAKGRDFLLVQSAGNGLEGTGVEARWNSPLTWLGEGEAAGRILTVGAAAPGSGGYFQPQFSNVGPRVDVLAPGVGIYGAEPDGYGRRDGTSPAAAQAGGVCAMAWTLAPGLSGAELRQLMIETASTPVEGADACMIDARAALEAAVRGGAGN